MYFKPTILFLLFSLVVNNVFSQKVEGIATYKTDRKIDLKMDGDGMSDEMTKSIQAQLRKQFQKEFTLTFNNDESIYEEVEALNAPNPAPAAGGISIVLSGSADTYYRNLKEKRYVDETEIMSKPFLVKDVLEKYDWELGKETKNIGQYTCFKATYTREVDEGTFDSATDSIVNLKKTQVTTAWYTLDIPVPHGPGINWGLPGLILQIEDGDQTILCSKIVINPTDGIKIKEPNKGKEVDQAQFDKIQEKKAKEMMEQFKGRSRKGDKSSFSIKIGG